MPDLFVYPSEDTEKKVVKAFAYRSGGRKEILNGWVYDASGNRKLFYAGLAVPQNLSATSDALSVVLSWDAVTNATRYRLRYRLSGSSGSYTTLVVSGVSQRIVGLTANTAYEFSVRAENASLTSDYSASVTATVLGVTPPVITRVGWIEFYYDATAMVSYDQQNTVTFTPNLPAYLLPLDVTVTVNTSLSLFRGIGSISLRITSNNSLLLYFDGTSGSGGTPTASFRVHLTATEIGTVSSARFRGTVGVLDLGDLTVSTRPVPSPYQ